MRRPRSLALLGLKERLPASNVEQVAQEALLFGDTLVAVQLGLVGWDCLLLE